MGLADRRAAGPPPTPTRCRWCRLTVALPHDEADVLRELVADGWTDRQVVDAIFAEHPDVAAEHDVTVSPHSFGEHRRTCMRVGRR